MPLQTTRPYTIIYDGRDSMVVDFPLPTSPENRAARVGVRWDADRDDRILLVLEALRYRDPRALARFVGIAEHRGVIDCWVSAQPDECTRALSAAADIALRPGDRWTVNPARVVPASNFILDRERLPLDSPLQVVPAKFALGLVRA